MVSLFIGHHESDDSLVDVFCSILPQVGINPWVDHKNIDEGDDSALMSEEAIKKAHSGLFIVSKQWQESSECMSQFRYMDGHKKRCVVAKINNVHWSELKNELRPYTRPFWGDFYRFIIFLAQHCDHKLTQEQTLFLMSLRPVIRVKLAKSATGNKDRQDVEATIKALLGSTKVNTSRDIVLTREQRGQIEKIDHLLHLEFVSLEL